MSFELSADEKRSLLEQRLKAFYAEKFQHELNKATAESINNPEAIQNSEEAIATLDSAITTHLEVLDSLSE